MQGIGTDANPCRRSTDGKGWTASVLVAGSTRSRRPQHSYGAMLLVVMVFLAPRSSTRPVPVFPTNTLSCVTRPKNNEAWEALKPLMSFPVIWLP